MKIKVLQNILSSNELVAVDNRKLLDQSDVLTLTGDLPSLGNHPQAKPVKGLDLMQFLWIINKVDSGYDMMDSEIQGKANFFPGAVVKPEADTEASFELQPAKMEKGSNTRRNSSRFRLSSTPRLWKYF